MRLRQKLFAAIIAAMAVMSLFLVLASFLNALDARARAAVLERRLTSAAIREFESLASAGGESAPWTPAWCRPATATWRQP